MKRNKKRMHNLKNMLKQEYERLLESKEYKQFIEESPEAYLAHAFLMKDYDQKHSEPLWQFGYYLRKNDRIVSFYMESDIKKSIETEIFKKNRKELLPFDMAKVKKRSEEAIEKALEIVKEDFKGEIPTKIILIAQTLNIGQVFNITVLTHAFNTINIKFDTETLEEKSRSRDSVLNLGKQL